MSLIYISGNIYSVKYLGTIEGKDILEFQVEDRDCFFVGNRCHQVYKILESVSDELVYKIGGIQTEAGMIVSAIYIN